MSTRSAHAADVDTATYAHGLSFRLLGPGQRPWRYWAGVDQRLSRLGLPLEVVNTRLPVEERRTRAALRPLLRMPRLSTFPIAAIINHAVRVMPRDTAYLNVGVWQGFTFFAGMAGNADRRCVGVDDFSETYAGGSFGDVRGAFLERFERLRGPAHEFHELDYRDYFERVHDGPIGVYVYDAEHGYDHQLRSLELAEPHLRPGSVVLLDDASSDDVRRAIDDFLREQDGRYEVAFSVAVASKVHPTFWNGIAVLRRR